MLIYFCQLLQEFQAGSFDALERLLEYVNYGKILPFSLYKADYAAKKGLREGADELCLCQNENQKFLILAFKTEQYVALC